MIVLSRKKGESIVIDGDTIRIEIVEIRGDRVRVGIQAPEGMSVHRTEYYSKQSKKEEFAPQPRTHRRVARKIHLRKKSQQNRSFDVTRKKLIRKKLIRN